jgi:hypothetical protein
VDLQQSQKPDTIFIFEPPETAQHPLFVIIRPRQSEINNFLGRNVSSSSETICSVQEKSYANLTTMGSRQSPLHVYCTHVPPLSTTSEL